MHFIYALVDPITDIAHYIGMTNNAHERYIQHCSLKPSDQSARANWIRELKENKLLPGLKILETVEGEWAARDREIYWIGYYQEKGIVLTNILTPPFVPPVKIEKHVDTEKMSKLLQKAAQKKSEKENKIAYNGKRKPYAAYRLGKESGINSSHAYRVLHGQALPSREKLIKICQVLGCSYQEAKEIMDAAGYSLSQKDLEEERPAKKKVAA
jgi:transcriptional regulator with XRE-family HTH domain